MPSLSIDCISLLQVINCNANKNSEVSPHPTIVNDIPCIPITFIDNFMNLLYVTFFFNLFIIQTQVCIFWMLYWDQLWSLARQENIYSGKVNTDMLWCLYYLGVHIKFKKSGKKWQTRDLFYIQHKGTRRKKGRNNDCSKKPRTWNLLSRRQKIYQRTTNRGRKKDVSKSNVSCYLAADVLVIKSY